MKKVLSYVILSCFLLAQNAGFAIEESKLDLQLTPVILNSRLKKDFAGYKYVITNNSPKSINILNAQIINGEDGSTAYIKSEAEGGIGVTWAIAGPVGLVTLGLGWVVGIIATPIVWAVQNSKNKKTRRESIAYTNMVPLGILNSTESLVIKTLVPIGAKPQLKLTIMDDKTKDLHTFTK